MVRVLSDPLRYYHTHYAVLTAAELRRRDPPLYERLQRDGLLDSL